MILTVDETRFLDMKNPLDLADLLPINKSI